MNCPRCGDKLSPEYEKQMRKDEFDEHSSYSRERFCCKQCKKELIARYPYKKAYLNYD